MEIDVHETKEELEEQLIRKLEEQLRYDEWFKDRLGFMARTNLKSQYYRLNHQVDLAMKAYDDDFEKRRNQLRAKLLEDEACLTYEYVEKAQNYSDSLFEEKKQRAEAAVKASEKRRQDYVNEMLARQQVINCEELRNKARIDRKKMVARANLLQIEENRLKKEKEQEQENMYHELMLKDWKYDSDNAALRKKTMIRVDQDKYLKMQITAKEYAKAEMEARKAEEKEVLRKYNEQIAETERMRAERNCEKKENLKNMQLEQIRLYNELKKKRNDYDKEIEDILIDTLTKESEDKKLIGVSDKEEMANRLARFEKAYKEVDKLKKNLDEYDTMKINTVFEEISHDRNEFRRKRARDRDQDTKDRAAYWAEQVHLRDYREQKHREREETDQKYEVACRTEVDNALKRKVADDAKQLQSDLQEQIKYKQLLQKRENEDRAKLERAVVTNAEQKLLDCAGMNWDIQPCYHPSYDTLVDNRK